MTEISLNSGMLVTASILVTLHLNRCRPSLDITHRVFFALLAAGAAGNGLAPWWPSVNAWDPWFDLMQSAGTLGIVALVARGSVERLWTGEERRRTGTGERRAANG